MAQLTFSGGAEFDVVFGATPLPIGRRVLPFTELSEGSRYRIAEQVAAERRPRRWLDVGGCQIPSRGWYEWHWHRGIDPDRPGGRLDPHLRSAVIHRDGYVCGLCGGAVEPTDVHIDHVLPRAHGGEDHIDNLQVTHSLCNLRKGARI